MDILRCRNRKVLRYLHNTLSKTEGQELEQIIQFIFKG
jgi:hypothetical protein